MRFPTRNLSSSKWGCLL